MAHDKHDVFFKRAFGDVRVAASAISAALPPEVSAMLDWSSLALAPTESVDAAHNAFRTDLVYSVRLHGRDARVVVLVEHKSAPASLLAFQILQYQVQLWDTELRRVPAPKKLPPIIPIVLSHARRRQPRDLIESVDLLPDERLVLERYVPRVFFEVDELASASDRTLLGRAMLPEATLVLLALRDVGRARDVPQMMERWRDVVRATAEDAAGIAVLRSVARYLLDVHEKLDVEALARWVQGVHASAGEAFMTTARELMDQGRIQGRVEGRVEGRLDGRRETVGRQLRFKFRDSVTAEVIARIERADAVTLDAWEERILSAETLEEVLR